MDGESGWGLLEIESDGLDFELIDSSFNNFELVFLNFKETFTLVIENIIHEPNQDLKSQTK